MTKLEEELRAYIKDNLMSPTTLLLIKEIAIPILIEYLNRKDKQEAAKMVEEISKDPKNLSNLPEDMKKNLIDGLTDIISDILNVVVGKKIKQNDKL